MSLCDLKVPGIHYKWGREQEKALIVNFPKRIFREKPVKHLFDWVTAKDKIDQCIMTQTGKFQTKSINMCCA